MANMATILNCFWALPQRHFSSSISKTSCSGCLVPVSSFWGKERSGIAHHFILPLPTFQSTILWVSMFLYWTTEKRAYKMFSICQVTMRWPKCTSVCQYCFGRYQSPFLSNGLVSSLDRLVAQGGRTAPSLGCFQSGVIWKNKWKPFSQLKSGTLKRWEIFC